MRMVEGSRTRYSAVSWQLRRIDVFESGLLRLANVMHNRAGSAGCQGLVRKSESVESGSPQLIPQNPRSIVRIEQPVIQRRLCDAFQLLYRCLHALGKENFAR